MMKFSSLNRLYTDSCDLFNGVLGDLSKSDIGIYSNKLLLLRSQLADLKFNKIAEVTRNVEIYKNVGQCQKLQLSAQSKLIKKALPILSSEADFYLKIESIYERVYGEAVPNGFGKRLARSDRKNLMVLDALHKLVSSKTVDVTYNQFIHQNVTPKDYELFGSGKEFNVNAFILDNFIHAFKFDDRSNETLVEHFVLQNFSHPSLRATLLEKIGIRWLNFLSDSNAESLSEKYKKIPKSICQDLEQKYNERYKWPAFSKALHESHMPSSVLEAIELTRLDYQQQLESLNKEAEQSPPITFFSKPFFSILTICSQEDLLNRELSLNLELGKEAIRHAVEKIPYSSNFTDRENASFPAEKLFTVEEQFADCRLAYTEKTDHLSSRRDKNNAFRESRNESKGGSYCFVGNCGELSSVAFNYLIKQKCMPVGRYTIEGGKKGGDHTFVVIGDKDGDPSAVVVDAWMRQVYPARLIGDLLVDCTSKDTINGKPMLVKFDPVKQNLDLALQFVNLSKNYDDLYARSGELVIIKDMLANFHATDELNNKMKIADSLLAFLKNFKTRKTSDSKCLIAQLEYFIAKAC